MKQPSLPSALGSGEEDNMQETRVLIVEDHPDAAEMLSMLLEAWGCQVRVAHTGAQAVVEARQGPVDLILCDLNLPDMSGIELLPRLRSLDHCAEAVAVSLSGAGGRDAKVRSREAGFIKHLVKPAPFEELKQVVELTS